VLTCDQIESIHYVVYSHICIMIRVVILMYTLTYSVYTCIHTILSMFSDLSHSIAKLAE